MKHWYHASNIKYMLESDYYADNPTTDTLSKCHIGDINQD